MKEKKLETAGKSTILPWLDVFWDIYKLKDA